MTNEEVKSLHKILDYLKDEEKNFEGCTEKEKRNHIYKDILVLRNFESRVNLFNNRLSLRIAELMEQNKKMRNACGLALEHLKNCQNTDEDVAEVGGKAISAIEEALHEKQKQQEE